MHFIDYYEKEEVLWNTKLQSYRNRDARGEAVKRIVKVCYFYLIMSVFT